MKKTAIVLSIALAAALALAGCQAEAGAENSKETAPGNPVIESNLSVMDDSMANDSAQQPSETETGSTDDTDNIDLSSLPSELASAEDLTGNGGYLLIGQVPDEDIGIYCDNAETRDLVYIRYGTHIQSFQQEAWADPTILPRVEWEDWDGDGKKDLVIDYLRHEGEYFDGETTSPGVVGEKVVYQWDGEKWTDIHFSN